MADEASFIATLQADMANLQSLVSKSNHKAQAVLTTMSALIAAESTRIGGGPPPPPPASNNPLIAFGPTSEWNTDVSKSPLLPNGAAIIAAAHPWGVHPDFGTVYNGAPNGIPYNIVPANQPMIPFTPDLYPGDADPGPYPIPPGVLIEAPTTLSDTGIDHHVIIAQLAPDGKSIAKLFEMYQPTGGAGPHFTGGFGCIFDCSLGDKSRAYGKTSADAAGLPIYPGLVKYDEVAAAVKSGGDCGHAFRFTIAGGYTKLTTLGIATHVAGWGGALMPFGCHVRMKASFDLSKYSPEVQAIGRTLKRFGMIMADNGGNWSLSGAPDPRWNDDQLVGQMGSFTDCWECIENGPERTP